MTKSVKRLIVFIGVLSLASGIYSAVTGSEFHEYFFGIFIGGTLIGSVFFLNDPGETKNGG